MVKKDIIDAYKSIDLKTYIDSTLKAPDTSLIKTELHKHERLLQGVNQDIYKTFLLNTDILVKMLEKTNDISTRIEETEGLIEDYRAIFMRFREDETLVFVDEEKRMQFHELMETFDESAQIFKTNKRYLIHSAKFGLRVGGKYEEDILVFTNDILIIGEKTSEKYLLKNAFNYNVIQIIDRGNKIIVQVTPFEFVFENDEENVRAVMNIYQEIMFKNRLETKDEPEDESDHSEYIDFLLQTENYQALKTMKNVNIKTLDVKQIRGDIDNLLLILKFIIDTEKRDILFLEYLTSMFDKNMFKVDISHKLNVIIDEFFENFNACYDDSIFFVGKYMGLFKPGTVFKTRFILFLKGRIEQIFKLLKRRIFGKYSSMEDSEKYIDQIRSYLIFDGYDFSFLADYFKTEKEKKAIHLVSESKRDIKGIVDEMIEQDYL